MYTHSVISQRSPSWFYFLVKSTSLHTTSPAPVFAIQMYIQSAGHPKRFIPRMLLFLFFFFMFQSQIFLFWHLLCFALIPERVKIPFPCPHSGKSWRQRQGGCQWSGQQDAGRQSNSHSRWEAPKLLFSPNYGNMSTYWHIRELGILAEKMLIQVEEDTGTSSLTFEKICFKFTAHTLWHSMVYAELFWRSGPF